MLQLPMQDLDDTPQTVPQNRLVESWDFIRSCKDGSMISFADLVLMYRQKTLDGGLASFEEARQAQSEAGLKLEIPLAAYFGPSLQIIRPLAQHNADHKPLPPPTDYKYRRPKPLTKLKLQQP